MTGIFQLVFYDLIALPFNCYLDTGAFSLGGCIAPGAGQTQTDQKYRQRSNFWRVFISPRIMKLKKRCQSFNISRILPKFHQQCCIQFPHQGKDDGISGNSLSPLQSHTTKNPLNVAPTAREELPETKSPQTPDFQIFQRKYPLSARIILEGKNTTMSLTRDLMQVVACKLKYWWVSSFDAQF